MTRQAAMDSSAHRQPHARLDADAFAAALAFRRSTPSSTHSYHNSDAHAEQREQPDAEHDEPDVPTGLRGDCTTCRPPSCHVGRARCTSPACVEGLQKCRTQGPGSESSFWHRRIVLSAAVSGYSAHSTPMYLQHNSTTPSQPAAGT